MIWIKTMDLHSATDRARMKLQGKPIVVDKICGVGALVNVIDYLGGIILLSVGNVLVNVLLSAIGVFNLGGLFY